jgi:hypothetical protein
LQEIHENWSSFDLIVNNLSEVTFQNINILEYVIIECRKDQNATALVVTICTHANVMIVRNFSVKVFDSDLLKGCQQLNDTPERVSIHPIET